MSKQTAVEWLVKELNQKIDFIPMDKWDMIRDIIEKAKAMHREEHRKTWIQSVMSKYKTFEQYYNNTYKGGEQ